MHPNIDALVVHHKQTAYNFFWSIEVDAIAMCNRFIVLHKARRFLVMAYEMPFLFGRLGFVILIYFISLITFISVH